MAIVLTRDTVGACCCTASFGVSFLWEIGSCEGSETNMSCKKVSLRRYLRSLLRGDCVGMTCGIGGSCVGIEVKISARKVSLRRYLSFSSQEDTKLLASSHASMTESSVYSTMSDNCLKVADSSNSFAV